MDVPNPVTVHYANGMKEEEVKQYSQIIDICKNMIQQIIMENARANSKNPNEALLDMDAWIYGFQKFPFPFFNFGERQSQTVDEQEFSVAADKDVVESILNIKGVDGLKDAVVKALGMSNGKLYEHSEQETDFKYFGIITVYNADVIENRIIKFNLHAEKETTKILCASKEKRRLHAEYDTHLMTSNKERIKKMSDLMINQLDEELAKNLLAFAKTFYAQALKDFQEGFKDFLK